jgi:hypothetical protein
MHPFLVDLRRIRSPIRRYRVFVSTSSNSSDAKQSRRARLRQLGRALSLGAGQLVTFAQTVGYPQDSGVRKSQQHAYAGACEVLDPLLDSAGILSNHRHLRQEYCARDRSAFSLHGGHSRSGPGRPLTGSTAERLLDCVACHVLVVEACSFPSPGFCGCARAPLAPPPHDKSLSLSSGNTRKRSRTCASRAPGRCCYGEMSPAVR